MQEKKRTKKEYDFVLDVFQQVESSIASVDVAFNNNIDKSRKSRLIQRRKKLMVALRTNAANFSTLKRLGLGVNLTPLSVCPFFFVTFDIIISHFFHQKFKEILSVIQKISFWIFTLLLNYFHYFPIFWIFWHFLIPKKLTTSAYNRWCQPFYTFSLLWIGCLTIV